MPYVRGAKAASQLRVVCSSNSGILRDYLSMFDLIGAAHARFETPPAIMSSHYHGDIAEHDLRLSPGYVRVEPTYVVTTDDLRKEILYHELREGE